MKVFSLLLFISLIAAFISSEEEIMACNPYVRQGDVNRKYCADIGRNFIDNECCMVTYTDNDSTVYHVCVLMNAHMITHFEQYKRSISDHINSYYPLPALVSTIDYFECSSNYLKLSLLALLLILF